MSELKRGNFRESSRRLVPIKPSHNSRSLWLFNLYRMRHRFFRRALAGVDILTPANDYFQGIRAPTPDMEAIGRWVPLGASPAVGFFKDCFGDSNHFIRAQAYKELGGFSAVPHPGLEDSTGEDWEFFARAVMQGYSLQVSSFPRNLQASVLYPSRCIRCSVVRLNAV